MPAISLLIKPASSSCNMRCAYCFYADVANRREVANYGIMSEETLETIVKKVFAYADTVAAFGFQGGEPTVAGLDFFKNAVALQKKYNVKNIRVTNAIQTNGLNINDEWAQFFHDNKSDPRQIPQRRLRKRNVRPRASCCKADGASQG